MNKFWIITRDVYKKNVKSIAFIIMILFPFIATAILYLGGMLANNFSETNTIGIVSDNENLAKELEKSKMDHYSLKYIGSEKDAQKQLNEKEIEAFLVVTVSDDSVKGELYSESSVGSISELTLKQLLNNVQSSFNIEKLNLTPKQMASLSETADFIANKVTFDADGKMKIGQDNTTLQTIVSFVFTIVLWFIIVAYCSIIAQEIASEKGTRIMEVILSSTKARTHFYGKLTGVLLVALTQIVVYALSIGIGYSQLKNLTIVKEFLDNVSVGNLVGPFLLFMILFFFFGLLAYAVLSALCGSLVSKPEDTPKAVQPIVFLSMIGYMIGVTVGTSDPQNIIIRVTSYIPLISSFTMPIRLATETASINEAIISLVILIIFSIVLTQFSAKLYKSNVLIYNDGGVFKSLKQSFTLLKNERKK